MTGGGVLFSSTNMSPSIGVDVTKVLVNEIAHVYILFGEETYG